MENEPTKELLSDDSSGESDEFEAHELLEEQFKNDLLKPKAGPKEQPLLR